jgi:hypothetical protein
MRPGFESPWGRHFLTLQESRSQNQQVLRRSIPDRGERNADIKSNEPSFMLNRESKQVYVGQLPRPMNSGRVHDIRIQHTDFIQPEFMDILVAGLG